MVFAKTFGKIIATLTSIRLDTALENLQKDIYSIHDFLVISTPSRDNRSDSFPALADAAYFTIFSGSHFFSRPPGSSVSPRLEQKSLKKLQ